jgi:MSHA pilin protein MshA
MNRLRKLIRSNLGNNRGFTMIELILVIIVLGILAVFALPQFFNFRTQARRSAMGGVVGSVRSAVNLVRANNLAIGLADAFPATLDAAAIAVASPANPVYGGVLQTGVSAGEWEKTAALVYNYTVDAGDVCTYTYVPATGTFIGAGGVSCP